MARNMKIQIIMLDLIPRPSYKNARQSTQTQWIAQFRTHNKREISVHVYGLLERMHRRTTIDTSNVGPAQSMDCK